MQVHRVYINAPAQRVWDALRARSGPTGTATAASCSPTCAPGGAFVTTPARDAGVRRVRAVIDGEVLESDPPRRLVQTWRMLMDDGLKAEGFTRLTYELVDETDGVTRLTVTHDLTGAPNSR